MIEQLYNIVLLVAAVANIVMGCSLLDGNKGYPDYEVYRRSRMLTALTYLVFAAGFIAHSKLEWRLLWPAGASALSVTYFHIGAVLFGWSHISLLNPNYLTRHIVIRDVAILVVGIVTCWTAAAYFSLVAFHLSLTIFFLHALYISYIFYRTLLRVRRLTGALPQSDANARWWTAENRMMVIGFQRSIRVSCHLIVIFGLGSVVKRRHHRRLPHRTVALHHPHDPRHRRVLLYLLRLGKLRLSHRGRHQCHGGHCS